MFAAASLHLHRRLHPQHRHRPLLRLLPARRLSRLPPACHHRPRLQCFQYLWCLPLQPLQDHLLTPIMPPLPTRPMRLLGQMTAMQQTSRPRPGDSQKPACLNTAHTIHTTVLRLRCRHSRRHGCRRQCCRQRLRHRDRRWCHRQGSRHLLRQNHLCHQLHPPPPHHASRISTQHSSLPLLPRHLSYGDWRH